jgi:hypothetical protein
MRRSDDDYHQHYDNHASSNHNDNYYHNDNNDHYDNEHDVVYHIHNNVVPAVRGSGRTGCLALPGWDIQRVRQCFEL